MLVVLVLREEAEVGDEEVLLRHVLDAVDRGRRVLVEDRLQDGGVRALHVANVLRGKVFLKIYFFDLAFLVNSLMRKRTDPHRYTYVRTGC